MPSSCCATSCGEPGSMRQPLKLGNELVLYSPVSPSNLGPDGFVRVLAAL
jgi:hypothetical protein